MEVVTDMLFLWACFIPSDPLFSPLLFFRDPKVLYGLILNGGLHLYLSLLCVIIGGRDILDFVLLIILSLRRMEKTDGQFIHLF